jgi:hypothetical protein
MANGAVDLTRVFTGPADRSPARIPVRTGVDSLSEDMTDQNRIAHARVDQSAAHRGRTIGTPCVAAFLQSV